MSFVVQFPGRVGSQRPRLTNTLPQVQNLERQVTALGLMMSVRLDPFQRWYLAQITGIREDGKWSALECCIEIPRQNGKTGGIEILMIYHLIFMPASRRIVYSAHEFKTTFEIFMRIDDLLSTIPALYAQVEIKRGKDNLSITNKTTKQRIVFMARSRKAGRGMVGDIIILDEAFAVTAEMMAAIMPTLSSRSAKGNPQIIFLSSAGTPDAHFLNGLRERALGPDPGRLFFAEWSAPEDVDSDDREYWYLANPALGERITEEYVADELRSFRSDPTTGEDAWRRERLGIRESAGVATLFDIKAWNKAADPAAAPSNILCFSVDVTPDRSSASISLASLLENGDIYVELIDRREGTSWVPARMAELSRKHSPLAVLCDDFGGSGTLIEPMRKAGVRKLETVTIKDYVKACGDFYDMVHRDLNDTGPVIVHIGQKELQDAVAVAKKKMKGETAWVISRKDVMVDISPLVAAIQAIIGIQKYGHRKQETAGKTSKMMVFG